MASLFRVQKQSEECGAHCGVSRCDGHNDRAAGCQREQTPTPCQINAPWTGRAGTRQVGARQTHDHGVVLRGSESRALAKLHDRATTPNLQLYGRRSLNVGATRTC